jgi:hypothetical protein
MFQKFQKRVLVADRVRRPPREGFSWIDRRFLREFAVRMSGDAVFMYLFLSSVADKEGVSYYSDSSLAVRLRIREEKVASARDELLYHDLIAFQPPFTQVLSLPHGRRVQRGGPVNLGSLFASLIQPEGKE